MPLPARLQDLPPAQAHLCLKIRDSLAALSASGPDGTDGTGGTGDASHSTPNAVAEAVGPPAQAAPAGSRQPLALNVALSGGVDSSALLLALHLLSPGLDLRLHAVHLDHALRPESAAEAEHCAALCADLGIPFHAKRADVAAQAAGMGLEEAARVCRYAWYAEMRERTGAAWTVLGHQLNDLAEDVLMRLIRGAGWPGLGGMPARDDARRILRPLLYVPRADLAGLLEARGLSPLEDPSNADARFFRNRVRHEILPLFLRENPSFLETAAALHRAASLDAELFRALLPAPPAQGGELPRAVVRSLPKALRLRLFKSCLDALGPGRTPADSLHRLYDLCGERKTGAVVQFPGGKTALITGRGVLLRGK